MLNIFTFKPINSLAPKCEVQINLNHGMKAEWEKEEERKRKKGKRIQTIFSISDRIFQKSILQFSVNNYAIWKP